MVFDEQLQTILAYAKRAECSTELNEQLKKTTIASKLVEVLLESKNGIVYWNELNQYCFKNEFVESATFNSEFSASTVSMLREKQWIEVRYDYTCAGEEYEQNIAEKKCENCGEMACNHQDFYKELRLRLELVETLSKLNEALVSLVIDCRQLVVLNEISKQRSSLVPFLGAGISFPFGIPSWSELLYSLKELLPLPNSHEFHEIREEYQRLYENENVFGMLELLDKNSEYIKNETQLQSKIGSYISNIEDSLDLSSYCQNNVQDVLDLNTPLIITTNYDDIVEQYYSRYRSGHGMGSKRLKSITFSNFPGLSQLQEMKAIFHIHGSIDSYSDIILSAKSYGELYSNQTNNQRIRDVLASKCPIFIGFSLNDKFVINELEQVGKLNNGFLAAYLLTLKSSPSQKLPESLQGKITCIQIDDSIVSGPQPIKGINIWVVGIHLVCMYIIGNIYLPNYE